MADGEGERRPTLAEIINSAVEAGLRGIRIMLPAKVTRYDSTKALVDCQIQIQDVYKDEEDERQVTSVPVVTNVPVEFMGAGGYRLTFPLSDGTTVIDGAVAPATLGSLVFSHVSLDKYLTGDGSEVDPQFDHNHALNDCKFVPGLRPFGNTWSSIPTDKATIGSDSDANGRVAFTANTVELGQGATKGVARSGDPCKIDNPGALLTWMGQVEGALNALSAGTVAPLSTAIATTPGIEIKSASAHIKAVD